jgi:transposase
MTVAKRIELTQQQVDALLLRVKANALEPGDYEMIKAIIDTLQLLCQAYDQKTTSIKRLLRRIFGARTEKTKNVLESDADNKTVGDDHRLDAFKATDDSTTVEDRKDTPGKKPKGHGRNGADAYTAAERIFIPCPKLKHGDPCPLCTGKLYRMKVCGVIVKIVGRAPVAAKIWEYEKLRCHLCGKIFEPDLPQEAIAAKDNKYDETARSMIALLKYGFGFPFYRQEKLQASLGVPLASSTQWDKAEQEANLIYPAFEEMKRQAAQGDIIHNDDTTTKILELIKSNHEDEAGRKGMFTTGILSIKEGRKIAVFFSGQKHAGENFADLLKKRDPNRDPPIQMCDALSRNFSETDNVILTHCNAHARRNFVDVAENFPQDCRYVLEVYKQIYKNDDITKKQQMSPHARLRFHQDHSGPVMEKFDGWLNEQFCAKKVEPNSALGQAITYMQTHWGKLTRFLHVPGAPLDNNIVEQALKRVILNRKNSLFYKTLHGAYIGDMYMSLIHTCILNGSNPFDYLTQLQKHSSEVFKNPSQWMPWNYQSTLAAMVSDSSLNIEFPSNPDL